MTEKQKKPWKPGKRDLLFLGIIATVVIALVLGTSERKTKPVADDTIHQTASSKAQCMSCHNADGVLPQAAGHTLSQQCFQCHCHVSARPPDSGKPIKKTLSKNNCHS